MTNTTLNVPRELMERARAAVAATNTSNWSSDLLRDIHAILSAPSPAGVDGLEVIGWYTEDHLDDKSATTYSREVADRWLAKGWPVNGIANAADAQAIIDGLRGEVGAQRIKTCTALKERNDAREERDSFQRIGIRQIEHRYQLAALLLEKFPRIDPHHPITLNEVDHCCEYVLHKDRERLHCAIDAALSAGKEGE